MHMDFPEIFSEINGVSVGYKLKKDTTEDTPRLERITFSQFIPPYFNKAENAEQVYLNLKKALLEAQQQQNTIVQNITVDRTTSLEVLTTATLQREAIKNAMDLIKDHYFTPANMRSSSNL